MTKRDEKFVINIFVLITHGTVEKTGSDESVLLKLVLKGDYLFLKITSYAFFVN